MIAPGGPSVVTTLPDLMVVADIQVAGGVAYFAHIGGFAAGALFGLLARKRVRRPWYEIR